MQKSIALVKDRSGTMQRQKIGQQRLCLVSSREQQLELKPWTLQVGVSRGYSSRVQQHRAISALPRALDPCGRKHHVQYQQAQTATASNWMA